MTKETNNSDEIAIRELVKKWMSASQKGDLHTVLSLMSEDVVFLVPQQQPFGKAAFKEAFEKMSADNGVKFEGTSDIEELIIIGDWAFARARLKVKTTPLDGSKAMSQSGYTLTIFKKESDGQWRLARDANLLAAE